MLLFEKTVVQRGKNVEATREGLKVMIFTGYFGKDATSNFFFFFFFFGKTWHFSLQMHGKSDELEREWRFKNYRTFTTISRSSPPGVFLGKSVLKI